ncbi:hypothetical protein niasHS_003668 [Heterodera schachtii]|uniref:Uncharacterized protein n=1 Tax=Heterodera schachtii TaxID=97005 RepID=A0ABD2KHL9_HETSC
MSHLFAVLLVLFALSSFSLAHLQLCHSCLAHCKIMPDGKPQLDTCECGQGGDSCEGQQCFAKLELFPEESVAVLQKGCVDGLPPGIDGCNYSGQTESIHCYCNGQFCNDRTKLNNFSPAPLPVLECCECSQPGGDEQCPMDSCLRNCRGNYCLVDFDGVDQGCGQGMPRLQNFLRIPNYLSSFQGGIACAHYQASEETAVNGCVCTEPSGMCNQRNRTIRHQMQSVLTRRADDLNYCYSLSSRTNRGPFDAEIYRKSTTCEGHFCFLSLSTRELVVEPSAAIDSEISQFVANSKPRHELLAGCLKVDDDSKVSVGCTAEYSLNLTEPISVHCICDSHLCNYYDLLARASNGTLKREESAEESNSVPNGRILIQDAVDENGSSIGTRNWPTIWQTFTSLLIILYKLSYFDFIHSL